MKRTAFYSWQSDLAPAANRNFILSAIDKAAKLLGQEGLAVIEVDRDTTGVSGSPDIGQTIFAKIGACDMFVGDVSLINAPPCERLTPNPNVLVELGYALHALGESRLILVLNTASGGPEQLPFDLRSRRILTYNLDESASVEERSEIRRDLVRSMKSAMQSVIRDLDSRRTSGYEVDLPIPSQKSDAKEWRHDPDTSPVFMPANIQTPECEGGIRLATYQTRIGIRIISIKALGDFSVETEPRMFVDREDLKETVFITFCKTKDKKLEEMPFRLHFTDPRGVPTTLSYRVVRQRLKVIGP